MGFGLDSEHGHCRGRGPSASRGARTGHHQGKAKAARLTRTAFLGSGEWRHWRRRGQAREKRTGGRRKKAYAGLPLEPEKSLSKDLLRPPSPPPPWLLRTPHLSFSVQLPTPRLLLPAPPPPPPASPFLPSRLCQSLDSPPTASAHSSSTIPALHSTPRLFLPAPFHSLAFSPRLSSTRGAFCHHLGQCPPLDAPPRLPSLSAP